MLDMIRYLESLVNSTIYVITRSGVVKGILKEVGRNGSLLLEEYEVVRGRVEEVFMGRQVLIRGDNVVGVATDMDDEYTGDN